LTFRYKPDINNDQSLNSGIKKLTKSSANRQRLAAGWTFNHVLKEDGLMKFTFSTWFILCALLICSGICTAGSLQPTAPPTTGTMKTLTEIEPRIAIGGGSFSTTYTITSPGSYYLAGNRTLTANVTGIKVDANNVTIDLMGYTLAGNGVPANRCNGIEINYDLPTNSGRKNVEVRNGTITLFGDSGISAPNIAIKDIRIINIRSVSNKQQGIALYSFANRIENCLAGENEDEGICAGRNSILTGCIARDNGDTGIYVYLGSIVTSCYSFGNNGLGIYLAGSGTISNSICYENTGTGIQGTEGCTIIGNTTRSNGNNGISGVGVIKDNYSSGNHLFGIYAGDGTTVVNNSTASNNDGFYIGNGCTVTGNSASNNTHYGFSIAGEILLDQNTAMNNPWGNINSLNGCTVPSGNHIP
jgi:parallel beta-helix repeat protein